MGDAIEYNRLGRTALQVSRLCLGTMNFGTHTAEADARVMLDAGLEQGLNFVDTADQYGGVAGGGVTESIIGRWLSQGNGRREQIMLATKLYEPMSERPNDAGLSARHIRLACDASLRRLQTDHIDLYQMHHIDRTAPWDEVWQAMETLVAQGKVTYVGSSNFPGWTIAQANEAAKSRHFLGLVSEQSLYNLTERTIEMEVIPACQAYGVGLLPWSPLAGGLLGGVTAEDTERRSSADFKARVEARQQQLATWEQLCADLGEAPANVAVAWLLHQPAVSSVVLGPRTPSQLQSSLAAAQISLDDQTLQTLDLLFPGPGPAPEAYAW